MTSASRQLGRVAFLSLGIVGLIFACGGSQQAKPERLCTPGAYVFCRCQDRAEGSKLCNADAQSFGPCEPCETFDNPEGDLEPGDPTGPVAEKKRDGGTTKKDASAACGDGIVQQGEDCDDTDGCDTTCKLSAPTPPASSNACPGLEVHVWGGAHKPTLATKTNGSGNRATKTACGSSEGSTPTKGGGPDRVFKVTAHKTGTMTVATTNANYNVYLYASASCPMTDVVEWVACANKIDGVGNETISFPVVSGTPYYVFVDGALPSTLDQNLLQGNFEVSFSIP